MAEMAKTKVTPHAKHPEWTQDFIKAVQQALDVFEEHIHFPDEEVRCGAYKTLLEAYRTALMPVWNLAHFANINIILEAVSDKEMRELSMMTKWLQPSPATSRVTKDKSIPDVETIVVALNELRPARGVGGTMGLNQGPAYFTRSRSSPVRRPRSHSRSYSRSHSKTPERKRGRSNSKSPARSPVRCPNFRSCRRSRSASYSRSRSRSPSYSRSSQLHDPYVPVWKKQISRFPDYQRYFLRNVVS